MNAERYASVQKTINELLTAAAVVDDIPGPLQSTEEHDPLTTMEANAAEERVKTKT